MINIKKKSYLGNDNLGYDARIVCGTYNRFVNLIIKGNCFLWISVPVQFLKKIDLFMKKIRMQSE